MALHWLCFSTDPFHDPYANQMAGRRLHAVEADEDATEGDIIATRSVCGRLPAHGWVFDLFNEKKCARCLVTAGLHCPDCRGGATDGSAAT